MTGVLIFILGLIVGSFLNVVIFRLNTSESIVKGRSRCLACGAELKWFELIPVFSFLVQAGRCRTCKSKISRQYPIVELSAALIFYAVYIKWLVVWPPNVPLFLWWLVFWSIFLTLAVYDFYHKILPDVLVYSLGILAVLGGVVFLEKDFWPALAIGALFFLFFAGLWLVSKGKWMGLGDAKLFFSVGVFFGWPLALAAMFFSFWLGAIISGIAAIFKRSLNLKSEIPFGPFIFFGSIIAFFWGDLIFSWYLKIIFSL